MRWWPWRRRRTESEVPDAAAGQRIAEATDAATAAGHAAAKAQAKLPATDRYVAKHVRPEVDRFAAAIERAMRGAQ